MLRHTSDALLETPHAVATAVDLHTLGHQLAEAVRPGGAETGAFLDVWTSQIMPRTIEKRDLCIRPMIRPRCVCVGFASEEW